MTERIPVELVDHALEKTEGFPFERFAIAFYTEVGGASFVPLGGIKDGGADARDGTLFEDRVREGYFYQASVEADPEGKIRRTVVRLRGFGRDPRVLIYLTSQTVKYSDKVEKDLTDELDVTIVIRDGNYIATHVNDSHVTRGAFDEHLRHYTDYLKKLGASSSVTPSKHVTNPSVYVFLSHELGRRAGDESLVDSVVDALALWALEGTDPEAGILYDDDTVQAKIDRELPSVTNLVKPRLRKRLEAMSSKQYDGGRAVNWHRSENAFCLPYPVRQHIAEENLADETLRRHVVESFQDRLQERPTPGLGPVGVQDAVEVAMRALQLAFERNGLEFAHFLESADNAEYATITDCIRAALVERNIVGKRSVIVGDCAFEVVRGALYSSREIEREYLQRLSRTYALLFTLKTEPRLIEYFQEMTGRFRLYVGADQLVQALSEHYLNKADQMTRNTLLMASQAGARLILAEPVLDEVVHHLIACDTEYRNRFVMVEPYLNFDMARNAPHMLLRAYLYARINRDSGARKPKSWEQFVKQFCSYEDLHKRGAFEEIRQYLQSTFGCTFESTDDLEELVDGEELERLTEQLAPSKSIRELARHDALIALAVYGRRVKHGENRRASEFGYDTWWLTAETSILRHTGKFEEKHNARYIMRPDFLLNFLTLAPSAAEARRTFAAVFPSMLGIRLARRMKQNAYHRILSSVAEAADLDDARRQVLISKAIDRLKGDFSLQITAASEA
jgi:hypothetical protein